MDAEKFNRFFERYAALVKAFGVLAAAIVATVAQVKLLPNPFDWSWPEQAFAAVAAVVLVVVILRSRSRHVSRLLDPDALKLDPRLPEQLIGRAEDLRKLLNTLANRLVFLVSELGLRQISAAACRS